jgi:hypothetical protein
MKDECKRWLDSKIARMQRIESYAAEHTNESIAKKYSLKLDSILKLNYNENLFLSRDKQVALLKEVAEECDLRIYPQDQEVKLASTCMFSRIASPSETAATKSWIASSAYSSRKATKRSHSRRPSPSSSAASITAAPNSSGFRFATTSQ